MHAFLKTCRPTVGLQVHSITKKLSLATHRHSAPTTLEPREALGRGAGLGADPAACAGRKVTLDPVMSVNSYLPVTMRSTVLAVVEGIVLTASVSIVSAHYEGGKQGRTGEGRGEGEEEGEGGGEGEG